MVQSLEGFGMRMRRNIYINTTIKLIRILILTPALTLKVMLILVCILILLLTINTHAQT